MRDLLIIFMDHDATIYMIKIISACLLDRLIIPLYRFSFFFFLPHFVLTVLLKLWQRCSSWQGFISQRNKDWLCWLQTRGLQLPLWNFVGGLRSTWCLLLTYSHRILVDFGKATELVLVEDHRLLHCEWIQRIIKYSPFQEDNHIVLLPLRL